MYGNAVLKYDVKKYLGKLGEDGLANRDKMLEAVFVRRLGKSRLKKLIINDIFFFFKFIVKVNFLY